MHTISPAFTWIDTPSTAFFLWSLDLTTRSCTFSTVLPGLAGVLSTANLTSLPTIMEESSSLLVSLIFTVPIYLPFLKIVHLSDIAMISFSLCEIKRIDLPSFLRLRIICISSSISCGVSTAVGSSKIRISLSRYNIFNISVRCCIPTVISLTLASRSTCKP